MDGKKILILYTSIGLGHKSIAENIGYYLQEAGFEVELRDAHKVQDGLLARGGTKLYQFLINKFPFVWDWFYNTHWFISITLPFRTWLARFNYKNIEAIINQLKPDIVISTHNTASAIVSYLKQKKLYQGAFGIAFSDFHLHRFWLFKEADFYLANIEEQKQEMVKLGISPAKIFVCGITLKPKRDVDTVAVRGKLGIMPDEKVILIASGSQGTGVDEGLIKRFINQQKIKIIAACGKNKKLFESLDTKFSAANITALNYYSPMDELYAIADVFITKPGGMSIAESLRWQLPVIISHLLPGQERHNYNYLLSNNLVMPAAENLPSRAAEELRLHGFKQALANNKNLDRIFKDHTVWVKAVNELVSSYSPTRES